MQSYLKNAMLLKTNILSLLQFKNNEKEFIKMEGLNLMQKI